MQFVYFVYKYANACLTASISKWSMASSSIQKLAQGTEIWRRIVAILRKQLQLLLCSTSRSAIPSASVMCFQRPSPHPKNKKNCLRTHTHIYVYIIYIPIYICIHIWKNIYILHKNHCFTYKLLNECKVCISRDKMVSFHIFQQSLSFHQMQYRNNIISRPLTYPQVQWNIGIIMCLKANFSSNVWSLACFTQSWEF